MAPDDQIEQGEQWTPLAHRLALGVIATTLHRAQLATAPLSLMHEAEQLARHLADQIDPELP